MAYQSFKRVLGESHLERKCRLLFGLCLLLLITGSFWWYGSQTDKLVYGANQRVGRLLVHNFQMARHWEEVEKKQEGTRPTEDDPVHEAPKWDPSFIIDGLKEEKYDWRVIQPPNPQDIGPPEDDFEQELLDMWLRKGQGLAKEEEKIPKYRERSVPGGIYQYYRPIYAKRDCITCHATPFVKVPKAGLQEGDLMSVIQVSFSDKPTVDASNRNRAILLATAIITVFVAMVALYVIVRYVIVKPLAHLRDVANAISRGNTEVRAEIHTGDEFEDLASAFNRMLRYMVDAQEELRGLNSDLDSKVDELAQANMRLYDMNRMKGDFLATVSHELRTPLNSIIGFSDVLGSSDTLTEKQRRYVTNIQRSGRMLLEMINDILDLAKIESGKMEVRLTEFKIESVIVAQCDMARPLSEKKNIDLEWEADRSFPPLIQDQGKVQQILNNLLSNAIKFTPEGGRITVTARRDERGDLRLVVADTGVGIADNDKEAIFEKFRQGSTTSAQGDAMTREYSGTGLGLSIVKELCRLLGGEVTLRSQLGKGSTFTVRLPWTRTEQPHLESPLAEQLEELTRHRPIGFMPQPSPSLPSSPST
jgi:two-component system, NarL family, sensor histidine kinase BarA